MRLQIERCVTRCLRATSVFDLNGESQRLYRRIGDIQPKRSVRLPIRLDCRYVQLDLRALHRFEIHLECIVALGGEVVQLQDTRVRGRDPSQFIGTLERPDEPRVFFTRRADVAEADKTNNDYDAHKRRP